MGTVLFILLLSLTQVKCQVFDRLYEHLMKTANSHTAPLQSLDIPLNVSLGVSLIKVKSINTENGDAYLDMWNIYEWTDSRLAWSKRKFDNIQSLNVHPSNLWTPDIELYDGDMQESKSLAIVHNDGSVTHVPKTSVDVRCDLTNYTRQDTVFCSLKFGSWTYSGFIIDLQKGSENIDVSSYKGDRWEIVSTSLVKNTVYYPCCPEPYHDITATLIFRDTQKNSGWSFF